MSSVTNKTGARARRAAALLLTATLAGGMVQAAEPVGPRLTQNLHTLLKKEMAEILKAMQQVYGAIMIGDHATVAARAQGIHDSFILKQSLTAEDKKDLKAAVPPEFIRLDRTFHQKAAELAEAAKQGDAVREMALYGQMTEVCMACHTRYVTDRFPALEGENVPLPWEAE